MSVLSATAQQQVEEALVSQNLLTSTKLAEFKQQATAKNTPLLSFLVAQGAITSEALAKTTAEVNKLPYVNLLEARVNPEVLTLLPQEIAERYMAVPLGEMQNRLVVAMLDADNVQAVDFLSNKIGRPLKVYAASEEGIRQVIKQYDDAIAKRVEGVIGTEAEQKAAAQAEAEAVPQDAHANIKTIVQDSPISKALSTILEYAAKNRASDIHIEPLEHELRIRCRVDGVLREIMKLPKSTEAPLVSRIKILSNLKIDEHRTPQDGQFTIKVADKEIDLRIAIAPIVWGEQVVIRLLDKSGTSFKLEDMGFRGQALKSIRKGLTRSSGMIITSGPTGSGKSTTLYGLIQEIRNDTVNIVTLEDPVEYKIDGVNQIQVNPEVGLTFATGLRSILRQDPNIVMVGEIRDAETATLAIQAALTGHLVLTTLHTNSAAGILPRLLDMGIEPFLIASTVHTVIGQRLVRKVDENSKTSYDATPPEVEAIHSTIGPLLPDSAEHMNTMASNLGYKILPLRTQNAYTLFKGQDSPDTPGGYKGRMGLYEVFEVSEQIQQLILKRSTSAEIQKMAQSQGMVSMRQDGYLKALAGQTTLTEVNRVAAAGSA